MRVQPLVYRITETLENSFRKKEPPYSPGPEELCKGIEHVVFEYSNFICAHHYMEANPEGGALVVLVFNAFLVNCRQLMDFLGKVRSSRRYVLAVHYSRNPYRVLLPVSEKRRDAIDRQLAHISYGRVTDPRSELSDAQTRRDLFAELRGAFRDFLPTVKEEAHREEFTSRLLDRSKNLGLPLP
jgi:hypothetical protein